MIELLNSKRGPILSIALGVVTAVVYGALARIAFGDNRFMGVLGTVSIAFLFMIPLSIGALSQCLAAPNHRLSWLHAIFAPWIPSAICLALAGLLAWEVWFCVLLATPIFLTMSSLGGCLICLIFHVDKQSKRSQTPTLLLFILAPFIVTPLENILPAQDSIQRIESQIEIDAPAERVWQNIIRFSPVSAAESSSSFFHTVGLPRPLEATLSYEGVGAIRRGQWEDGLAFDGTITEWKPNEGYALLLKVDTSNVTSSPVPLQAIGGKYFDMVDDSYRIERVGNKVILHLVSTYRLTTHLNAYGTFWIDWFMRDIQNYILRIEKERCEQLDRTLTGG
jgi:hypothetical protein